MLPVADNQTAFASSRIESLPRGLPYSASQSTQIMSWLKVLQTSGGQGNTLTALTSRSSVETDTRAADWGNGGGVLDKMDSWIEVTQRLSKVVTTLPHTAYTGFQVTPAGVSVPELYHWGRGWAHAHPWKQL